MKFFITARFRVVTEKFARNLRKVGMAHVLVGGNAVDYWANPPATKDIDLAVESDPAKLGKVIDFLRQYPEIILVKHKSDLKAGVYVLYYVDQKEKVRVDLIMSDHPMFRWAIEESFRTPDLPVPVARAENL